MSRTWSSTAATLVTALLGVGLASCGGADSEKGSSESTHTYPAAVTKAYTDACVPTAKSSSARKLTTEKAQDYCQLSLDCVRRKLTLKQFETVNNNMLSGKANPDAKVLQECGQEAIKKLG